MLNFRLTEQEYLEVKQAAEAQGSRCVSDFARAALLKSSRHTGAESRVEFMFRDLQNRISVLDSQMFRLIGAVERDEPAEAPVLADRDAERKEPHS